MRNIFEPIENRGDDSFLEDVLAKGATTILYGKAGCGKSFLAIDMALHVVHGKSWHGLKAEKGKVLYICGEGVMAFAQRIAAWNERYRADMTDDFCAYLEPQMLSDVEIMRRIVRENVEDNFVPDLLIVDTFARSFSGNENSAQDTSLFVTNLAKLQSASNNCAVLVIHHAGKSASHGPRGSSVLLGAADTVYLVSKDDEHGGIITMANEKARNSEPKTFTFKLERQDTTMRFKKDGVSTVKPIKSAVPVRIIDSEWPERILIDSPKQRAKSIILDLLEAGNGEVLAKEAEAVCELKGLNKDTVRRAKEALGLKVEKVRNGWVWRQA